MGCLISATRLAYLMLVSQLSSLGISCCLQSLGVSSFEPVDAPAFSDPLLASLQVIATTRVQLFSR
jgi:hypothetical protein